ncbi:MAG: hypothetical protein WBQ60_00950 [Asticcacaulis sp.]
MLNFSSSKSLFVAGVFGLSVAAFGSQALADQCNDAQTTTAGKLAAAASSAKVNSLIPSAGKQMINLDLCEVSGSTTSVEFKLNNIGSDGLYWLEGRTKVVGGAAQDLKITSVSANLAAASAKAGVKLASN